MDYLWTPWRYRYIADGPKEDRCIFCDAVAANDDEKFLIVLRGEKNFVILNLYPYTSGHVMVVPYAHVADFSAADPDTLCRNDAPRAARPGRSREDVSSQGFNLGMNLGRAAGAGITKHLHLHVLPRWSGDANFMTVVGETRVEPEELSTTYKRLRTALAG